MADVQVFSPTVGELKINYFEDGDRVEANDVVSMIESMKMMIPVASPASGVVTYRCQPGELVDTEHPVAIVSTE
jgi:biotin carboxyl carrier protein